MSLTLRSIIEDSLLTLARNECMDKDVFTNVIPSMAEELSIKHSSFNSQQEARITQLPVALKKAICIIEDDLDYRPDDEAASEWKAITDVLRKPWTEMSRTEIIEELKVMPPIERLELLKLCNGFLYVDPATVTPIK